MKTPVSLEEEEGKRQGNLKRLLDSFCELYKIKPGIWSSSVVVSSSGGPPALPRPDPLPYEGLCPNNVIMQTVIPAKAGIHPSLQPANGVDTGGSRCDGLFFGQGPYEGRGNYEAWGHPRALGKGALPLCTPYSGETRKRGSI